MSDIIQEQDVPIEEDDIATDDIDILDELDLYQTDEEIEADVDEAMEILGLKKKNETD
jgi:hypothetical protein